MAAASPARWEGLTVAERRFKANTPDDNLPKPRQLPNNPLRQEPVESAGALDVFPLELLLEILVKLDVRSLAHFGLVNRRATGLVDALPEYRDITKHAPNALQGILAIGTGPLITCKALHNSLCTAPCEKCGNFGGYLYLFTCKRVCFLCLSQDEAFLPLTPSQARRKFGLNRREVKRLPHMTVVPGAYSPNRKKVASGVTLADYEHARLAGISLHGSLDAMAVRVSREQAQRLEAYNARLAEQQSSGGNRYPRRPPAPGHFDGRSGNPHRFVAIARVPWLDMASRQVERGFHCDGCAKSSRRPCHRRMLFSPASFEEHLAKCGEIQDDKNQPV